MPQAVARPNITAYVVNLSISVEEAPIAVVLIMTDRNVMALFKGLI